MSDDFAVTSSAVWLRTQWQNPTDIFTVLLILGGDVVQTALAQLSGSWFVPVSFSFGWVSYAVSAALSAVGDNRLLPSPQNSVLVINVKSGYVRQNQSYVISRIFRDYDYWKDPRIDEAETHRLADLQRAEDETARNQKRDPAKVRMGLNMAIYEATEKSGTVKQDNVWRSGIIVMLVQLAIAAVPWVIHKEWLTFFVTSMGTLLALASGALPQWAEEKWACRHKSDKTVVLTSGNGSHDAIVVIGNGRGLDLEDLGSSYRLPRHPNQTRVLSLVLAVAWIALLVCVAGYRQHTWYLLGVGGIGIIHNIVIAGAPREPSSFGIHLVYQHTIVDRKVMGVLALAEAQYPRLGLSLLTTFFPGDLRVREQQFWAYARRRAHAYMKDGKLHRMPDLDGNEDIPGDGWLTQRNEESAVVQRAPDRLLLPGGLLHTVLAGTGRTNV